MFRSLTVYQLTIPAPDFLERLPGALEGKAFKPCTPKQERSDGWVPAITEDPGALLYSANGGTLFCLRSDVKNVSSSWVKEQIREERQKHERAGKEFNKTDEQLAKAAAIESKLPDTAPDIGYSYAYLDHELSMLFVARTGDGADEFTSHLGIALKGNAPLQLLGYEYDPDPCITFTKWVQDTDLLGENFTLGRKGDIKHAGQEGGCGMINIKQEDLEDEEIVQLLDAGRQVCSIALQHECFSFRLRADLGFRNIELSDYTKSEGWDEHEERVTQRNQFAAFVWAMRDVMRDLEPLLGGWKKQEMLDLRDHEEQPEKTSGVAA